MNAEPRRGISRYIEGRITWGNIITVLILLASMGAGYVQLISKVDKLAQELAEHKLSQMQDGQTYVRKDVQEVRNRFVDEKLSRIEAKLDILISR